MSEGARILEERHMISAMLYLSDNDGCTKTELYRGVSTNPRMPEKLNMLESAGLIVQEASSESNAVRVHLTDMGRDVVSLLNDIDSRMTRSP